MKTDVTSAVHFQDLSNYSPLPFYLLVAVTRYNNGRQNYPEIQ
jgi:hypothetical protein